MEKKIRVYIVGSQVGYFKAFDPTKFVLADDLYGTDIVLFTGGEDVSPGVYGAEKHISTYNNEDRDATEAAFFDWAKENEIMMVGICRGSQFLTAMSGGKLVQDCNNHAIADSHKMIDINDNVILTTSTHHQMMHPFNLKSQDYKLLAWAYPNLSTFRALDPKNKAEATLPEPEIVWYNKSKALAVQGHPEFSSAEESFVKYFNDLVVKKFNNENKYK